MRNTLTPTSVQLERTKEMPNTRPPAAAPGLWPVRLGFNRIAGLSEAAAGGIVAAREAGAFASPEDLTRRAHLDAHELSLLAQADALAAITGHRHQAAWGVAGIDTRATPLLRRTRTHEAVAELPVPGAAETVLAAKGGDKLHIVRETADLWFHCLVLLALTQREQILAMVRDFVAG